MKGNRMVNANDVKKLLKFANAPNFGDNFAVLTRDLADLLHKNKVYVVTVRSLKSK